MPRRGEVQQQRVEVALGADVDAARRVVEQQHLRVGRQPARHDDLLLVAARQRGDRVLGIAEHDPQPVDVLRQPRARARVRQQPSRRVALQRRDAEVLARPTWTRTATRRGARAGRRRRPRRRRSERRKRVLTVALEPGEPDELARAQLEPRDGEHDLARPGDAAASPASRGEVVGCRSSAARARQRSPIAALERRHGLARPHHRAAVADLGDLVHPVRDEDHRGAGRRRARAGARTGGRAWRRPAPRSPRRGSGCAGRAPGARARQHACRSLSDSRSAGRRAAARPPAARRAPRSRAGVAPPRRQLRRNTPSEPIQTFSSTERGSTTSTSWNTVAMPAAARAAATERHGLARPAARAPGVGPVNAGEDLHERRLARPVLADDAVHLAAASSNEHERSACVGPNALASSVVRNATVPESVPVGAAAPSRRAGACIIADRTRIRRAPCWTASTLL